MTTGLVNSVTNASPVTFWLIQVFRGRVHFCRTDICLRLRWPCPWCPRGTFQRHSEQWAPPSSFVPQLAERAMLALDSHRTPKSYIVSAALLTVLRDGGKSIDVITHDGDFFPQPYGPSRHKRRGGRGQVRHRAGPSVGTRKSSH